MDAAQQQKVNAALQKKGLLPQKCPECTHGQIGVSGEAALPSKQPNSPDIELGNYYPLLVLQCNSCGFTKLFSTIMLGL